MSEVYEYEQYREFFPRVMVPDTSAVAFSYGRVIGLSSLDMRANANPGNGNHGNTNIDLGFPMLRETSGRGFRG